MHYSKCFRERHRELRYKIPLEYSDAQVELRYETKHVNYIFIIDVTDFLASVVEKRHFLRPKKINGEQVLLVTQI